VSGVFTYTYETSTCESPITLRTSASSHDVQDPLRDLIQDPWRQRAPEAQPVVGARDDSNIEGRNRPLDLLEEG